MSVSDKSQKQSKSSSTDPSFWQKLVYLLVEWAFLKQIRYGRIEVVHPDGKKVGYGQEKEETDLVAEVIVYDWSVWTRLAFEDDIGFCEAYMDGFWTSPDPTCLISVMIEQMKSGVLIGFPFVKSLVLICKKVYRYFFRNTVAQSLANVEEHYDIGNDLYVNMLDPSTFSYTCALFRDNSKPHFIGQGMFQSEPSYPPPDPDSHKDTYQQGLSPKLSEITLCQAQINKIELLIRKGNIQKHHKVLELGCGFGGFSKHLAKTVGCTIDCYNLSVEQIALAKEKAKEQGVDHLINYVHDDYRNCIHYKKGKDGKGKFKDHMKRDVTDDDVNSNSFIPLLQYDVIISIGMLEHVGHHDLPTFFQTCGKMLKPNNDSILCVHTITHAEQGYEIQKYHYGFIQKYIFPGAVIPAPGAVIDAAVWGGVESPIWGSLNERNALEGNNKFELVHFENIGENYAPTLRRWRENFYKNLDTIKQLRYEKDTVLAGVNHKAGEVKYDSRFIRMWEMYLCNCEAEFLTGHMGLGHFIFKRPGTVPRNKERQLKIMPVLKGLGIEGSKNEYEGESKKTN